MGAEEINSELEYLRQVLENLDNEIGLEYVFGIPIGTFVELHQWFKMSFFYDKTYNA